MNTKQLKDALIPFYKELKDNCSPVIDMENFSIFFPQIGKHFLENAGNGILFVGRATNGWKNTLSQELEYAANDQFLASMLDNEINKYWNTPSPSGYCCNKSPFWRVISCVAKHFYTENWSEHIAWTNLYKVAPAREGNPSAYVRVTQLKACDAILQKEIDLLSPRYIVFLTGYNWLKDFSVCKTLQEKRENVLSEKWGKYVSKSWTSCGRTYILSEHPQRKPEAAHISTLINLMNN